MIRAIDICVTFGSRPVLQNLSFEGQAGQAVALIGPNGAGKSTLLRVLARVTSAKSGTVNASGIDTDPRSWARHVSFVPQAHPVVFDFSVLEFVLMAFHAQNTRWALETAAQHDAALKALSALEVVDHADKPVTHLSAGEFQRVLMARTLLANTPVWLLDEPTANLDLKHQLRLLQLVKRHTQSGGTAVAILHDLGLVARFFDRVIGLKDGQIVFDGAATEVMTSDHLTALFDVPMRRLEGDGAVAFVAMTDPTQT